MGSWMVGWRMGDERHVSYLNRRKLAVVENGRWKEKERKDRHIP